MPENTIRVRQVDRRDVPTFIQAVDIYKRVFPTIQVPDTVPQAALCQHVNTIDSMDFARYSLPPYALFVATIKSEEGLAGYGIADFDQIGFAHVNGAFTRKELQGRGVGTALHKEIVLFLNEQAGGPVDISLETLTGPSQKFWERKGYLPIGRQVTRPLLGSNIPLTRNEMILTVDKNMHLYPDANYISGSKTKYLHW
jgi:GNAT superfamily N-acetyltransferase